MTIQKFATCFSGVTATQTAPTDANSIPSVDGAATCPGGLRGQQFMMEFDLFGSSGTVTATVDLYMWDADFRRWAKAATSVSLTSTATASGPTSRFAYALDSIAPYGAMLPVVSAISGTGATIGCRLGLTGPQ